MQQLVRKLRELGWNADEYTDRHAAFLSFVYIEIIAMYCSMAFQLVMCIV